MNEKVLNGQQLQKLISTKQRELDEIRLQLEQAEYKKHMDVFNDVLSQRRELINLIKENKLNVDDVRIFANKLSGKLYQIYQDFASDIQVNQLKRAKKNEARKQRQAAKEVEAKPIVHQALYDEQASTSADTDVSANNMSPAPLKGAGRTY